MSDDPTQATPRPGGGWSPAHGSAGPQDPRADPATRPTMRPASPVVPEGRTVPTPTGWEEQPRTEVGHSRTGVLWTGLILSALVLLLLLVFILQNSTPIRINFFTVSGTLPAGVALLLAAIAGLLLVAIPGGLRILQLRRAARRSPRRP
ncbi:lipopolysaccharide assembly protein LapA domain-containing protein [Pseudonocardia sp. MH-G8]|uniref:lipopolysaccharide assembly protein LapA domain-containing protein n=1 Tax=Pseudonocardia sp. MH-G8 TaxID=1854588 RepID=UPI001E31DFAF|nr:lipopolysaccharide assembly protein LapA domain-containing protein [Pseudonocardia sp. MH-G8]